MYVNRTVAIITPKAPLYTWLNSLPDRADLQMKLDERQDHVVLLPDETLDDEEVTQEVLEHYWKTIAFNVFNEWVTDKKLWPKNFSIDDFDEWFDLAIIDSPVIDLVKEPLERD